MPLQCDSTAVLDGSLDDLAAAAAVAAEQWAIAVCSSCETLVEDSMTECPVQIANNATRPTVFQVTNFLIFVLTIA